MQSDDDQIAHDIFTLAPLTSNLPIIQTPDGEFVPLRALCEIVGLRPSAYIGFFCQYLEPGEQRRLLPWDSPTGRRKDWCVERKYLSQWLINVPTNRIPPDQRETVLRLQRQSGEVMGRIYMQMIDRHHKVRREMFQMLTICATHEQHFQQIEELGARVFNRAQQRDLAKRLAKGRQLVEALAASARKSLGIVMQGPIVDVAILNQNNEITDTTTFPLFPIVGDPDPTVPEMTQQLHDWALRFHEWLDDLGAD